MDVAAILREIDAEIRKLSKARQILVQHIGQATRPKQISAKKKSRRRKPEKITEAVCEPAAAKVQVTVLPPRRKREYRRRVKNAPRIARAIDTPISAVPVFVPRAGKDGAYEPPAENVTTIDAGRLEAAIRKSLLGNSVAHASY